MSLLAGAVDEHGLIASRRLDDGRWLCVQPLLFDRAQLAITVDPGATVGVALARADFGSYADTWDYATREAATFAMCHWDGAGEPTGWIRHPRSGRRLRDGVIVQGAT